MFKVFRILILTVLFHLAFNASSFTQTKSVLILVDNSIIGGIDGELEIFKQDLHDEGYFVIQKLVSSSYSPPTIKSLIRTSWSSCQISGYELDHVILVGDIKAAYFIGKTGILNNPEALVLYISLDACDQYYGDQTGRYENISAQQFDNFISNPPENIAELNTYQSCDDFKDEYLVSMDFDLEYNLAPPIGKHQYKQEITVGRIMTHNLSIPGKSEIDLLKDYFHQNHKFRIGQLQVSSKSVLLDAISTSAHDMQGMDWTEVFAGNESQFGIGLDIYQEFLTDPSGCQLLYLCSHSGPNIHTFVNSPDNFLTANTLMEWQANSVFYILNACSSCRWDWYRSVPDDPNYLGGMYVFDHSSDSGDFGLAAMGFTGVGGFNNLIYFSEAYAAAEQNTYGEMFQNWFNENLFINFSLHNYVFLGDPTLSPIMPVTTSDATLIDLTIDGQTIDGFQPDVFEYEILLNPDNDEIPIIGAIQNNSRANTIITQANVIPDRATVTVVATDLVTCYEYNIHFKDGSTGFDSPMEELGDQFLMYPNPAKDFINIILHNPNEPMLKVELYNATGDLRILAEGSDLNSCLKVEVPIFNLPVGLYFVRVLTSRSSYTRKIIKK